MTVTREVYKPVNALMLLIDGVRLVGYKVVENVAGMMRNMPVNRPTFFVTPCFVFASFNKSHRVF